MSNLKTLRLFRDNAFLIVIIASLALILTKAVADGLAIHEKFGSKGNDDIMRLLSVRDWLAGQGWYDMMQYRLLPPDGVSMHWSRYIDAGIAAIIVTFAWLLPVTTAETIALTVWPTLILVITLFAVGFGTRRVFGTAAACYAVLCVVLWPLTADMHSSAGNLDHHNIQMLMMTVMTFAVVWPSRPITAGLIGGLAAAFSLAVGLESLVFVVGVGCVVMLRAALVASSEARQFLLSFCIALTIGCILLWLGQIGPDMRMALMCDQLAPPTLALVGIATLSCIFLLIVGRLVQSPLAGLTAAAIVTAAGLALAWPVLSHCLAGPYAQIPPDMLYLINTQIYEAKPGLVYAKERPAVALALVLPIYAALIFGIWQWIDDRSRSEAATRTNGALGLLLVLCLIGVPMMLLQMRAVIIAGSVAPIIVGPVVARRVNLYLEGRDLKDGLMAIVMGMMMISPMMVVQIIQPVLPQREEILNSVQSDCRGYSSLVTLNELPPASILTHVNFGPALMWATHHSSLAAPYHRSADAFLNGIVPFQMEEADFVGYVRDTTATHLLLCRGFNYQSEYVRGLASGESADWLRRVPVSSEDQLLFEILR